MEHFLHDKLNYWIFIILMMLGLWAMISKNNLIKKVIGMNIFQAAVILFYVSIGAKQSGADIPIYPHELIHPKSHESHVEHVSDHSEPEVSHGTQAMHVEAHEETDHESQKAESAMQALPDETAHESTASHGHKSIASRINPDDYDNPLPHVLMLTAIVVGVATLGVALSLIQRIYRLFGSIEENEVIAAIANETADEYMVKTMQQNPSDTHGSHA